MKQDDYVKIVAVDDTYRYGYIIKVLDKGFVRGISLWEEEESKIAFDAAHNALRGEEPIDYIALLTEVEKHIIPLLAIGLNTNKIAEELSTSPTTVRAQIRTLRIKLQLDDRAQLNAFSPALNTMLKKQAGVDQAIAESMSKDKVQ